jgi:hypothetical protein
VCCVVVYGFDVLTPPGPSTALARLWLVGWLVGRFMVETDTHGWMNG